MPYTILADGRIQTDDLDEAIRIAKKMANGAAQPQSKMSPDVDQSPATTVGDGAFAEDAKLLRAFAESMTDEQREALRQMRDRKRVPLDDMCKLLGVSGGNAVGGVLAAISKRAKKVGLDFSLLVIRIIEGGQKIYVAQPLLLQWTALK